MLLIALGRVMQFFLLFATIKMATTLLAPAEMARVYLVLSMVSFYAMIFLNPVGMFMNRRLHAWNESGKVQHYYDFFWLYLLIVCGVELASLMFLVNVGWIGAHTSMGWLVLLSGGLLLFSTVNQVVIPGLNMFGHREWFVVLTLATVATSLLASVALVLGFSPNAEAWVCGQLIGQLLIAVVGWKVFFKKLTMRSPPRKNTKAQVKMLFAFTWPVAIAVGLGWMQTQGYRFMMESTLGLTALGLFAAGYGISAGIISAFESVFATYFQPMFYKRVSNGSIAEQTRAWNEYAGAVFPSLIFVSFVIIAIAPDLTRVMLGPNFQESSQFIVWGVVAEFARLASGVFGLIAHARMKTRLLLMPGFTGALIAIVLLWLLMPVFGSTGVGVALALSLIVSFFVIYVSTRNEFVVKLPKKMLVMSVAMGAFFFLLADVLQRAMGENVDVFLTVIRLLVLGIVFLMVQYALLRPLLSGKYVYE